MPVTRFDVTLRRPLAGFPGYEELKGRLHFAIDPLHPANRRITDVELAPCNAAGRVEWSADVSILLPVDRAKCSGRVMLDVVNRGNTVAVPNFNRATRPLFGPGSDPNPPIDVGDGFLMKRGFVVISCGWQGDVPGDSRPLPDAPARGAERAGPAPPRTRLLAASVLGARRAVPALGSRPHSVPGRRPRGDRRRLDRSGHRRRHRRP